MTSLKRWHPVTTRPDVHCIRSRQPIPRESRQPKNPRDYESIEALRDELMKSPWGGWSFAGLLNSLSESSMGKGKAGAWYKSLLMWSMQRNPELWRRDSKAAPQLDLTAEQQDRVEQLAALLLCKSADVCRIIHKYPQMLEMEAGELVLRLVGLKHVLPGCDVASLVELQPSLFLEGERQKVEGQIYTCVQALRQGLPGADVDEMIEQDPTILLFDVEPGIAKLKELWDVDEQALSNSDPFELALAIRALSTAGPPKKF